MNNKRKYAVCDWCFQEMSVDTCTGNTEVEFPDGLILPTSTEHFDEPTGRCYDCNIKHGGFHHPGCDIERCPKCGGQIISCGCLEGEGGE